MQNNNSQQYPKALFILYLTMFLVIAGVGIVLPFLPYYAKEMGANAFQLGMITALFSLAQAIAAPLWGRISDKVGRKPVLIIGLIGYALSFFLMVWASTVETLLLSRLLGGLLSASAFPTAQAYLIDITPPDDSRGYAMGRMGAASNLGLLLGPAFGGGLAILGIRTALIIGGVFILITAILAAFMLPSVQMAKPSIEVKQVENSSGWTLIWGRDSVLLWITLLVSFGSSTMYTILGYYMIERFNASVGQTAAIFSVMGGVSAGLQVVIVGKAMKSFGEDLVVIGSLVLGVVGFIGVVFAMNVIMIYICVVVISASLALVRPSLLLALSKRTKLGQGLTMGTQGSFDSFGRVIGPLWAGWVFNLALSAPYWTSAIVFAFAACIHFFTFAINPKVSTNPYS